MPYLDFVMQTMDTLWAQQSMRISGSSYPTSPLCLAITSLTNRGYLSMGASTGSSFYAFPFPEKTWTYLTRMLSRGAMGMGLGAVTNGTAVSAEAMVIDADLIRCARRIATGIESDHLEQAAREIMEVGHGGNFMMADATMALMRDETEYFIPPTFNRAGTTAPSILERAHERVEQITATWRSPVPETIVAQLERLLA